MKIAFFDAKKYEVEVFNKYQNTDNIIFTYIETNLNEQTVNLAYGYDGVCIFVNDEISKQVIDKLIKYGCKIIALRCAGYNNVDINYAKDKITVVRVPAYSPYAVAEHAIAMLLTLVRKIHKAYIRTRDYNFSLESLTGFDLHEKTIGVIGTGRIGQVFINICKGFGMNVIAYDTVKINIPGIRYVSLEELFSTSDIISFHCPLTAETYHMLNRNTISQVKNDVIIINTSRGALIDSEILLEGIRNQKIGGACLDVYEEEADIFYEDKSSLIPNDEILSGLLSMPNVIITSHQAFLTKEALQNIAETTFINIKKIKNNEYCENTL